MLKKIIFYSILILSLVGYLFFRGYDGDLIPYPRVWQYFFLGIFILVIFWLIRSAKRELNGTDKNTLKRKNELIKNGLRIEVDLLKCVLDGNNEYVSSPRRQNIRVQALDHLYDSSRSISQTEIHSTRVDYETKLPSGEIKNFSTTANSSSISVQFLFEKQKTTYLYINSFDYDDYYFDLEFLE